MPLENPTTTTTTDDHSPPTHHPPTGLRILCLHDANASASRLQTQLTLLGDRLYQKHGIDLVFVNAPLCSGEDGQDRVWFERHGEQLVGLDASLCLLQQMWASMSFWGVLGIGQGAAIGSLLSLLPEVKPPAKFGVFVEGYNLIPEAEVLVDEELFSCLHIVQEHDKQENSHTVLMEQFGGTVHRVSSTTNTNNIAKGGILHSKKVLNVIGKFIIEQKKKLRFDNDNTLALALQNQLHLVEQEASRLIAQQIAHNPPGVLMAVVAPQAVAAGGMKRRAPNEEGGGAPCPPEFLLRRDNRGFAGDAAADEGKASRRHPSERPPTEDDPLGENEEEE